MKAFVSKGNNNNLSPCFSIAVLSFIFCFSSSLGDKDGLQLYLKKE